VGLILLAALINFVNRLTIAVLAPVITVRLGLSSVQFATLTTSFLIAYTLSQGISGKLYDKVGTKCGFIGALGFGWLILWLFLYASPEGNPRITLEEYELLQKERELETEEGSLSWRELLRHRETWAIVTARFLGDPVWWLHITWLPLYLYKVRHFSLRQIGWFTWLPFVAADAGSLFGGWLSGRLIQLGWTVDRARKSVISASMVFMCCGTLAAVAHSATSALVFIALVLFGFQSWIGNVQTLPGDYFPEATVGTVTGMGGVGTGIGAMLLTQATGFVVDRYSYTPILVEAGLLPILATVVLLLLGANPPTKHLKALERS
jgi:ACS family hexuronate transporter-like MFS transporter